jgi:hypothetical protein
MRDVISADIPRTQNQKGPPGPPERARGAFPRPVPASPNSTTLTSAGTHLLQKTQQLPERPKTALAATPHLNRTPPRARTKSP